LVKNFPLVNLEGRPIANVDLDGIWRAPHGQEQPDATGRLCGDEYGRMKFDNLPLLAQFNWPLTFIEWTLILMRYLYFNNGNQFGIPKQLIFLVSAY